MNLDVSNSFLPLGYNTRQHKISGCSGYPGDIHISSMVFNNFLTIGNKIKLSLGTFLFFPDQKLLIKLIFIAHTVKPTEPKQVSCDYPCPRILWPVCGSDDRVYPNDCMMEKAACETGKNIVLKTGGDCDPPVFKLLEKQNQAQQKEKESASGTI
jgi:hypothetical protein